jgi:ABC-type dipeptide/oligopeptide/nickel transport system permease component
MLRFITRRVAFILAVCIAIIFLSYLGMGMVRNSEGSYANYDMVSQARLAWQRSTIYITSLVEGEISLRISQPGLSGVDTGQGNAFFNSSVLLAIALGGSALIGLPLGAFGALTKHKKLVTPLIFLVLIGISTPVFFSGFILQQIEILYLFFFGRSLVSVAGFGWDIDHMLLPILVLSARPIAYLTRQSFIALDRVMEENYIQTAYAKGLGQRYTVLIHALRNVAVPILTAVGVSLRFSLGSLPIVEFLFLWPGMGLRLLQAINNREAAIVVTLTLMIGLSILGINLLLDITYRIVDPRIRDNDL